MGAWRCLNFEFTAMASPCSLRIDTQDEALARHAAQQAIAEVHRIEHKFSRYREDSVVSSINRMAGVQAVEVDEETAALLDFADQLWQMSEGRFDITSGVLRRAWNFQAPAMPDAATLQALLGLVGWPRVIWHAQHCQLPVAGMELDFGGFGKEYAADRAALRLLQSGLTHALVNLGGDVHATGARGLPEVAGAPWPIAIQHPRNADEAVASIGLLQGGLATSGDYERFFEHEGRRYCHILDPASGWPVSDWQSVSVLAANTTAAGAMSTIAMLKGPSAVDWLDLQQARYFAVSADGTLRRRDA
jgi:thiamine biosynthesis lipoprotein